MAAEIMAAEIIAPCLRLTIALVGLFSPLCTSRAQAQIVSDGATTILNNLTNSLTGDVTVGANGSSALLIITNGALLTNTLDSFIGRNDGAASNAALVTGSNSRWFTGRMLNVGNSGSFNHLLVTEGGQVSVLGDAFVGRETNANENAATVSGLNSTWSNKGNFYIGSNGSFNTVVVNDGGRVADAAGHLGYAASSVSNQLAVIGPNSTWTNSSEITVGYRGSFNSLFVTNGARVAGGYGSLGTYPGANNNQVVVTGPNSLWAKSGALDVGYQGSGNTLFITNGASVENGYFCVIGSQSSASNNQVVVTGLNSAWKNSDSVLVGGYAPFNTLLVNEGSRVSNTGGGIGQSSGADYNRVIVSGSVWSNSSTLFVGWIGAFNSLLVSNGSRVMNSSGYVGHVGDNNRVTVTGSGSAWTNAGFLYLGEYGSWNTLSIANGGAVHALNFYSGLERFSSNNLLHVNNGAFAAINAASADAVLDVRRGGVAFDGGTIITDHLLLTNGGQSQFTFNGGTLITRRATISNAQEFVVGASTGFAPATWDVRSNANPSVLANGLDIGSDAANATLLITNGATLAVGTTTFDVNLSTRLGVDVGSTNNLAIITSPGSLWIHRSDLAVGSLGSFNTLLITNGGRVVGRNVFVGDGPSAGNNHVIVTGSNSVWTNRGSLVVGYHGSGNSLLITNRGRMANLYGTLGLFAGANNNKVTVTGFNTVWTNNGDLTIGNGGSSNTLLIIEGARAASNFGQIGYDAGADNNHVMVNGSNSVWAANGAHMSVGFSGSSNTMLIINGGQVLNRSGALIGWSPGANNNGVTVTGPDSRWTNGHDLYVGAGGSLNALLITNGGQVTSRSAYVGAYPGGTNNQATVSGPGSMWINSGDLVVGYETSQSTLFIADRGGVQASNVYVGLNSGFENLLSVDNSTLTAMNPRGTAVLDIRRGSVVFSGGAITTDQLLITNGASSLFTFNAGTLNTRSATVANGARFVVGDGTSATAYRMSGLPTSIHNFANGLMVANNAILSGNGTIDGIVAIAMGGKLSPGTSIGTVVLNNTPSIQGTVLMEISKNSTALTNDQVRINGAIIYGGSLTVSNLGPTAMSAGDTFQLFNATGYAGAFSPLNLPTLGAGLVWTNKLAADGSIAVVAANNPKFNATKLAGTNLVFSVFDGVPNGGWTLLTATNVALPLTNWVTNTTGFFDPLGNLTLTNAVDPAQPKRFFNLREP
jgi:fibronectin-binding autotransporter adhesin